MKKQHQPKALDGLDRHSSAGHGVQGLLQEILREGTESRPRSWHSGILSLPGFFGSPPPSTKSPPKPRRYCHLLGGSKPSPLGEGFSVALR